MVIRIKRGLGPLMPPDEADFCVTIDFVKGSGNPRRIFDAASLLIEGFEKLDALAVKSIDSHIEPVLVLEDVETGSLKIWLSNVLKSADDQALKELDWKPAVGKYLVRAKYIALEFLDNPSSPTLPSLSDLATAFRRIASETDARHLPDYAPVNEIKLLNALEKLQDAKKQLINGDRLVVEADGELLYEVNLNSTWSPTAVIEPNSARETTSHGEMILTVRKPDMIGDTQWQFKHGTVNLTAPINDEDWLKSYHDRQIDIRPGDALRCWIKFVYMYDSSGVLEGQKMEIEKVFEVIKAPHQSKGFDLGDN